MDILRTVTRTRPGWRKSDKGRPIKSMNDWLEALDEIKKLGSTTYRGIPTDEFFTLAAREIVDLQAAIRGLKKQY